MIHNRGSALNFSRKTDSPLFFDCWNCATLHRHLSYSWALVGNVDVMLHVINIPLLRSSSSSLKLEFINKSLRCDGFCQEVRSSPRGGGGAYRKSALVVNGILHYRSPLMSCWCAIDFFNSADGHALLIRRACARRSFPVPLPAATTSRTAS